MDPTVLRLVLVVGGVLLLTVAGRIVAARRSRVRAVAGGARLDTDEAPTRPGGSTSGATTHDRSHGDGTTGDDGATTGSPATGPRAVLFGSATCGPCDTVKRLLTSLAAERADFTWSELDAADHLDLAREHGVRTVPTLLVLDADGTVVARTAGVPSRPALADAVARAAGERSDAPVDAAIDESHDGPTTLARSA